jgi:hypothetical protein
MDCARAAAPGASVIRPNSAATAKPLPPKQGANRAPSEFRFDIENMPVIRPSEADPAKPKLCGGDRRNELEKVS